MWLLFRRLGGLGIIILGAAKSFKKSGTSFENVRRLKQILAVVIAFNCLMGLALLMLGISNLVQGRLELDPTPRIQWPKQNYILLTALGIAYFMISCFGYFGIWESRNKYTKAFMMMSLSFGFGLLVVFFTRLVIMPVLILPNEQVDKTHQKFQNDYMYFIFLSAVLQVVSGFLAYIISVNYAFSSGFYCVTQEEADVADFFDGLNIENTRYTH